MSKLSSSLTGLLLRVRRADGSVDEHYAVPGITIGRGKANTIALAGDLSVDSVHHARVDAGDGGLLILRCPAAETALTVDGRPCREVALTIGLKVWVGKAEIECVSGRTEAATSAMVTGSVCPFCKGADVPLDGAEPRPCPTCGKSLLPIPSSDGVSLPVLVPTQFDGFRAEKFITRGGMGMVLCGVSDRATPNAKVAIKLVEARSLGDASTLARFRQEIELLTRVQHPNVVRPIGSGNVAGFDYLVMDWIDGGSLKDVLDRAKRESGLIPFDVAFQWFKQVVHGLGAIHQAGVIHRDVKPSNILIGLNGVAQVADLGIAKPTADSDRSLTITGQTIGTTEYMAPEQRAFPDLIDPSSDLYSLGVTFFEVLTGRLPVGLWRPISEFNSTVPDNFNTILMRMISQQKADRFTTAAEVIAAVEQSSPMPVAEETASIPTQTTPRSWLTKCVKMIQAAVTIAVAGWVGSCVHNSKQVGKSFSSGPSKGILKSFEFSGSPSHSPIVPGTKYKLPAPGTSPNYNPQKPGSKLTPAPNSQQSPNVTGRAAAHAYRAGEKGQLSSAGSGSPNQLESQRFDPANDAPTPGVTFSFDQSLSTTIPSGWSRLPNSGSQQSTPPTIPMKTPTSPNLEKQYPKDDSLIVLINNNSTASIQINRFPTFGEMNLQRVMDELASAFPPTGLVGSPQIGAPVQSSPAVQQRFEYRGGEDDLIAIVTTVETKSPFIVIVGKCSKTDWPTLAPAYNRVLQSFRELPQKTAVSPAP